MATATLDERGFLFQEMRGAVRKQISTTPGHGEQGGEGVRWGGSGRREVNGGTRRQI